MLQAEIIGNLGSDAKIKNIQGEDYISFDVAHGENDKNGKRTIWISVLWPNYPNNLEHLKQGAKVFVRGRLSVSTYTSQKTGQVNVSLSVFATEVQIVVFASKGKDNVSGSQERTYLSSAAQLSQQTQQAAESLSSEEEDLPF